MLQSSGAISFGDVRQELFKSTPQAPNYVSLPQNWVDFMLAASGDYNAMLPALSNIPISSFYAWNTWKRPVISNIGMQQFEESQGIRLVWEAKNGDIFRTAFAVYASTNLSDVTSCATSALQDVVRYAGEYFPTNSWITRYCKSYTAGGDTGYLKVVDPSAGFQLYTAYGDYTFVAPGSGYRVMPNVTTTWPDAYFSLVLPTITPASNGETWYVSVVPFDGREKHTLVHTPSPGGFTISDLTDPTSYSTYNVNNYLQIQPQNIGDQANGSGLNLYTGYTNWHVSIKTDTSATFRPDYVYYYYLEQNQSDNYFWYYLNDRDANGTQASPPSSGWTAVPGIPFGVSGLASSHNYQVWICQASPDDNESTGTPANAANGIDILFTTNAAQSSSPTQDTSYINAAPSSAMILYNAQFNTQKITVSFSSVPTNADSILVISEGNEYWASVSGSGDSPVTFNLSNRSYPATAPSVIAFADSSNNKYGPDCSNVTMSSL